MAAAGAAAVASSSSDSSSNFNSRAFAAVSRQSRAEARTETTFAADGSAHLDTPGFGFWACGASRPCTEDRAKQRCSLVPPAVSHV